MDFELYIAFIGACIVLGLIPGPNVALIVGSSLQRGTHYGVYSLLGSSSAMIPQLIIVTLGLSAMMALMSEWFETLRWIGVMYLLYLGFRQIVQKPDALDLSESAPQRTIRRTYWTGFIISLTNPKTLLFFGAFLPQFISNQYAAAPQMAILSITLILCVSAVDLGWAMLAGRMRGVLSQIMHWRNRLSGLFFIASGLGLALARKSS